MDKHLLINFVVNNDKLELLKARINRFNPLKVLKVQDHEIRHSNVLAWIFSPAESHNFDDKMLKRFLLKVLLKPDNDDVLDNMDIVYELQQKSLMDMKVFREKYHIDILLVSDHHKIVILIENKVYSVEHSNQLDRYHKKVKTEYPGYLIIPIFLTLNGGTHKNYFSASYDDILETIEFMIAHYKDRTSGDVIVFLNYYSEILKEKYAMDPELKRLCKEIYLENKDIIDMIYTVGNEIDIEPAVSIFTSKYSDIIPVSIKNKHFWFGVDSFVKGRTDEVDSWGGGFPVCFWFAEYYGKLKLTLEVGPFNDVNKRIDFLNKLESFGIKISERAKEPGRKYTRIYTRTSSIKDWTDHDEISEAMERLYEKDDIVKMRKLVAKAIEEFTW
ncbi:MAG: PD-(D/E)XK nuclease family protein [Zhaonellaceae bacterium]|jgi:hypothetical protein